MPSMSTPTRSFLSASIGPAMTVLTAVSAFINGPLSAATTIAFGLTVVWGIIEIAFLSYTPIASIELPGPSLLEDTAETQETAMLDDSTDKVIPFSDPNPSHAQRAA